MIFQSIEFYEICHSCACLQRVFNTSNTLLSFVNLESAIGHQYNFLLTRTKKVDETWPFFM
jgi:hypothetical protein